MQHATCIHIELIPTDIEKEFCVMNYFKLQHFFIYNPFTLLHSAKREKVKIGFHLINVLLPIVKAYLECFLLIVTRHFTYN